MWNDTPQPECILLFTLQQFFSTDGFLHILLSLPLLLSQCPDRSVSSSVALPPILLFSGPSSYWNRGGEPSSPAWMSLALPNLMHLFGWDQSRCRSVPQSLGQTCCTCSAQASLWMITYLYITWQLHVHTCLLNMIITSAIVIFYGLLHFFCNLKAR